MDANTARWAQHLMDSYRDEGGVNTSDEPGLPSKPEISALCLQIMQLLFPGYHDSGSIGKLELAALTNERVSSLAEDLRRAFLAVLPGKDEAGATATVGKLFDE
jgi:serine O-acetyltransferase